MEAMLTGTPVIASYTPVLAEYFEDGKEILFVKSNNPVEFREKALFLAENPDEGKKIASAGRQRVIDHYSIEHYAEALIREVS